eukprot:4047226-Prymnesium_polylepis.3
MLGGTGKPPPPAELTSYLRNVYGAAEPVERLRLPELSFFYRGDASAAVAPLLRPLCDVGSESCSRTCDGHSQPAPWGGGF